jgi:hypothetical protein
MGERVPKCETRLFTSHKGVEMVSFESRDRAVEVRIEALRAAVSVASPTDNIGNLMIHAGWLCQFLETGRTPAVESTVARGCVSGN